MTISRKQRTSYARSETLLCLTLLATMALTACATEASSPPSVCPPIVFYTPHFQAGAAKETSLLPRQEQSYIRAMLDDYSTLRDALRACGASYAGAR